MKSKTKSGMDDLVKHIGKLAKDAQKLSCEAEKLYAVEVDAILMSKNRDSIHIERCLDGMLDFCFDERMLLIYKKLCRYYYDIDPEAAVSYVDAYRDLWDEQKPEEGDK